MLMQPQLPLLCAGIGGFELPWAVGLDADACRAAPPPAGLSGKPGSPLAAVAGESCTPAGQLPSCTPHDPRPPPLFILA